MAIRKRAWKWLAWGVILTFSILAGALAFAFSYVTDSDTIATLIREQAPRFFPGSLVEVGRAQLRPLLGQITLSHIRLVQPIDGKPFPTSQIAWLNIKLDLAAFLEGRYQPREVVVAQPALRLCRRADGSWNLEGLLADPWPAPPLKHVPLLLVTNGTVELIDTTDPAVPTMILRDLSLRAEPTTDPSTFQFEGTARGGPFDRLRLDGTLNVKTGRVDLTRGELLRLNINETFCRCLPDAARARFQALGLTAGEIDLVAPKIAYKLGDPLPSPALLTCRLRNGTLVHPSLPDALNQVEAIARFHGDTLDIEQARARNGKTAISVRGSLSTSAPANGPIDLHVEVLDLELDDRLQQHTPKWSDLWNDFQPEGWIDLAARVVRTRAGDPLRFGLTVNCRDVGLTHRHFPYPIQHARGTLVWQGSTLSVNLRTLVGGEWLNATGTIQNPSADPLVKLDFTSQAFPVDDTLLNALPPDVREIVNTFHPTGTVAGKAQLVRYPPANGQPEKVDVSGSLDIQPGSSMRWDGMPYLVRDLTGRLQFSPDRWTFTDMKGSNGTATVTASGEVRGATPGKQALNLQVKADRLSFDQQLRDALPPEWQATWATLNPSGLCQVEATVQADPGEKPHYHLKIVPQRDETRIRLVLTPVGGSPAAADSLPPDTIQLPPMENISGTFLFDDGTVTMSDVDFWFREAPVEVRTGTVILRDTGEFNLSVQDLFVTKLRLDAELRKIMPPIMAEFSRRLDDGKTFWLRGNLGISWSGKPGEPARCAWDQATVVFDGNTIQTGLPLEQIQGQFESASGWSDGQSLALKGTLNLESVLVGGQQITRLKAPIVLDQGWARADAITAQLLGGTLIGQAAVSLDATPNYQGVIELRDANLAQYTRTLPGRQDFKGRVSAHVELAGQGHSLRSVTGSGWARVQDGDLGQLPLPLRWVKVPNFRPPTRTAFDSVEVAFQIDSGEALLNPVKFTGDAISLAGSGTVQLDGERSVNLRLSPLYGRNERRVPIVSDALREASGRVFDLHVTGPLESPTVRPEPLPDVLTRTSQTLRRLSDRREEATPR